MKKVLIALDYDPTAQKIAETGFSLAKAVGAEIVLLHIIVDVDYYATPEYSPIVGFIGFSDNVEPNLLNKEVLKKAAKHFLDKIKHHLGDETIQTVVKEGDIADVILKTAKETHADTIVMGTHSRNWLENVLVGSTAEKVLNHATIPLYIIPTKKGK
jgi:nucleotide-binding universal stress UspA family protein